MAHNQIANPCRFRADQSHRRMTECKKKRLVSKVFRCELYGECTLVPMNKNVPDCQGCEDYEPRTPDH
jgi:hypothetical protein